MAKGDSTGFISFCLAVGYLGFAVSIRFGIRPTRAECRSGPRPCPWVACRHHLINEESDEGVIHLLPVAYSKNTHGGRSTVLRDADDVDLDSMFDHLEEHGSCALDFGPLTLSDVGKKICVTRERVRQHEVSAYRKINKNRRARRVLKKMLEE